MAAALGGIGGPFAYVAGESLGDLTILEPKTLALSAIAVEWAIATPIGVWFATKLKRREQEDIGARVPTLNCGSLSLPPLGLTRYLLKGLLPFSVEQVQRADVLLLHLTALVQAERKMNRCLHGIIAATLYADRERCRNSGTNSNNLELAIEKFRPHERFSIIFILS